MYGAMTRQQPELTAVHKAEPPLGVMRNLDDPHAADCTEVGASHKSGRSGKSPPPAGASYGMFRNNSSTSLFASFSGRFPRIMAAYLPDRTAVTLP